METIRHASSSNGYLVRSVKGGSGMSSGKERNAATSTPPSVQNQRSDGESNVTSDKKVRLMIKGIWYHDNWKDQSFLHLVQTIRCVTRKSSKIIKSAPEDDANTVQTLTSQWLYMLPAPS